MMNSIILIYIALFNLLLIKQLEFVGTSNDKNPHHEIHTQLYNSTSNLIMGADSVKTLSNYFLDSEIDTYGTNIWTIVNLNKFIYNNGDTIPIAKTESEWKQYCKDKIGCYAYYKNYNEEYYGKLYNYYAIIDTRGLPPEGWRIPSLDDWKTFFNYFGNYNLSRNLMTDYAWDYTDGRILKGNNKSKFSVLPSGYINENGASLQKGNIAIFWSTTPDKLINIKCIIVSGYNTEVLVEEKAMCSGYSIRCIKSI